MTPEQAIDGYLQMLQAHLDGLEYPRVVVEAERALDLGAGELRRMDNIELSELSVALSGTAFAVGDEYNRQKAKAERCFTRMKMLVGNRLDHSIYGLEDKWMSAAFRHPEARQLWQIRQNALTVCLRLEGQSARLSELSRAVTNLIFSRKA